MDLDREERKRDSLTASLHKTAAGFPKPLLLCAAFVAGLFFASVTFNLALYFSLRGRTPAYPALPPDKKTGMVRGSGFDTSEGVFSNIVMLNVQYGSYNKLMPWQTIRATLQPGLEMASEADSTGLVLEPGLILTSAYVAVDSVMITAQRQGSSKRYHVDQIVAVATDLDLALLNVTDPAFWANTSDVVVDVPSADTIMGLSSEVTVAGFPLGADLSISKLQTRVARIEADSSGEAGRYGSFPRSVLTLYPSIGKDVTVGPVFDLTRSKLEGFIGQDNAVIPSKTISAFLQSYKRDKKWSGLGMLGLLIRSMQPDALRLFWDLPDDGIGVQIRSVCKDSPLARHNVMKGDVLREIDGEPILANGAVIYRKSQDHKVALPFQVLLGEKKPGDTTTLTIFRSTPRAGNGSSPSKVGYEYKETFKVTVALEKLPALVPRTLDEDRMQQPKYFILGGLVFTVFTEGLLTASKALGQLYIPPATQAYALHRWREDPDEEIVVMLMRLDHPCNKFYSTTGVQILKYFNGQKVKNMVSLVKMAGAAMKNKAEVLQFAFRPGDNDDTAGDKDDPDIVLDVKHCWGADKEILNLHQISVPFSMDLAQDYSKAGLADFAGLNQSHLQANTSEGPNFLTKRKRPVSTDKQLPAAAGDNTAAIERKDSNVSEEHALIHKIPWFNVVQIKLVSADQDFISPWKTQASDESRCSAIIVDKKKKLILTNSHCVANAKSLDILREDAPDPVPARVVEIAHDVDLAWITTKKEANSKFWESDKIKPTVNMSTGLPYIASGVRVVGYPTGGSSITITQGIVSRIDGQIYPNGLLPNARNTPDNLLIVQVDAAINPGNSGGPVFDEAGNLLGLAFAALQGAQSTGYVIPNVHCTNFIQSVSISSDGRTLEKRWQAQSESGALFRPVENKGIRKFLKLKKGETGVQVRAVSKLSPLWKAGVRKGDVLLKVANNKVEGTGLVLRDINGHKVSMPFDTLVTEKAHGDKLTMDFVRPGCKDCEPEYIHVEEAFHPIPPLVPRFFDDPVDLKGREHFAAKPTYFMMWGLIFGVFSNPVFEQAMQKGITVPWTVRKRALHNWLKDDKEEVVVLLQGLHHPCNLYYDLSVMRALSHFNGQEVNNLEAFMKLALTAELNEEEEYMRFTFLPMADEDAAGSGTDPDIVLHRQMCSGADSALRKAYNIPSRFSKDLRESAAATVQPLQAKKLKELQAKGMILVQNASGNVALMSKDALRKVQQLQREALRKKVGGIDDRKVGNTDDSSDRKGSQSASLMQADLSSLGNETDFDGTEEENSAPKRKPEDASSLSSLQTDEEARYVPEESAKSSLLQNTMNFLETSEHQAADPDAMLESLSSAFAEVSPVQTRLGVNQNGMLQKPPQLHNGMTQDPVDISWGSSKGSAPLIASDNFKRTILANEHVAPSDDDLLSRFQGNEELLSRAFSRRDGRRAPGVLRRSHLPQASALIGLESTDH